MNVNPLDRPAFFFGDARCQYSVRQIEDFIESGITDVSEIVHTISLPLRAGDISKSKTLTLHDLLTLAVEVEASNWCDLGDSRGIGRSNALDATQGIFGGTNGEPVTIPDKL